MDQSAVSRGVQTPHDNEVVKMAVVSSAMGLRGYGDRSSANLAVGESEPFVAQQYSRSVLTRKRLASQVQRDIGSGDFDGIGPLIAMERRLQVVLTWLVYFPG